MAEEQTRNGLINTARRWPRRTVPFYIDPVSASSAATSYKLDCGEWRELSMHYEYRLRFSTYWRKSGQSNGDNYLSCPLKKSHTPSLTHTKSKP